MDIVDLQGNILRTFPTAGNVINIRVERDMSYYAVNNALYCSDLFGKKVWEFEDTEVVLKLAGPFLDRDGNSYKTNNIVVVSADGKRHKQFISKSDLIFILSVTIRRTMNYLPVQKVL